VRLQRIAHLQLRKDIEIPVRQPQFSHTVMQAERSDPSVVDELPL
jgi:hypothetical protein